MHLRLSSALTILFLNFGSSQAISQWVSMNGPATRPVRCIMRVENQIFVGADSGGIFRSRDEGVKWERLDLGFDTLDCRSIARADTMLFAGTDHGIFRSTDWGNSWTMVSAHLKITSQVRAIALLGETVYAAIGSTVYATTDYGEKWIRSTSGLPNESIYSLCASGKNIIAGTEKGIFVCTGPGEKWIEANATRKIKKVRAMTVSGGKLFAGTSGRDHGFFVSEDDGASWEDIPSGPGYVRALITDGHQLFAGTVGSDTTNGVSNSPDGALNWRRLDPDWKMDVRALALGEMYLYAGTDAAGIWRITIPVTPGK